MLLTGWSWDELQAAPMPVIRELLARQAERAPMAGRR